MPARPDSAAGGLTSANFAAFGDFAADDIAKANQEPGTVTLPPCGQDTSQKADGKSLGNAPQLEAAAGAGFRILDRRPASYKEESDT